MSFSINNNSNRLKIFCLFITILTSIGFAQTIDETVVEYVSPKPQFLRQNPLNVKLLNNGVTNMIQ